MRVSAPIPAASLVLGYGPMLVLVVAALGAWALPPAWQGFAVAGGWLWGTAILLFLAGVTRGFSFARTEGAAWVQLGQMSWLFGLGFAALMTPLGLAFVLLPIGYMSVALFDPPAAARGLAPAHFARLRPPQMGIAIVALLALLARVTLVR